VIPTIITQLLAGQKEIRLGALHPTRDLLFVKDTAKAFTAIAAAQDTIGHEINIATGQEISIQDLAMKIINIIEPSAKIVSDDVRLRPEKSEVERLLGSADKISAMTSWKPEFDLDKGIAATIDWFRDANNRKGYKADIYNV
jgi:nucleoside-diphosphate-sugar epimerase